MTIAGFSILQLALMYLIPLAIIGFAVGQEEIKSPQERRHDDE